MVEIQIPDGMDARLLPGCPAARELGVLHPGTRF